MGLFNRITKLGAGIVKEKLRGDPDDDLDELAEFEDDDVRPEPAPAPKTEAAKPAAKPTPKSKKRSL